MSNHCDYWARIHGKTQNVIDFMWWLNGWGPPVYVDKKRTFVLVDGDKGKNHWEVVPMENPKFVPGYVGRIGHDLSDVFYYTKEDEMFVEIWDWCAWSFQSSAIETALDGENCGQIKSVPDLCRMYDLRMEVYTEETGCGLDEYYFFNGRNDGGKYIEEEFDHDDVSGALRADGWKLDENRDLYWRWTKDPKTGRRTKQKKDRDTLFAEKKDEIFPHEFRVIEMDIHCEESKKVKFRDFIATNKNSWGWGIDRYGAPEE